MLLRVTWTLFWEGYGLVVVCLISIPAWQKEPFRPPPHSRKEKDEVALPPAATPIDRTIRTATAGRSARMRRNLSKGEKRQIKKQEPSAAYKEKLNSQNRMVRKGLRQVARDMALCLNEVADHATTARELRQTLRLVIRQHPGLKDLPYSQAVQQLLWVENNL